MDDLSDACVVIAAFNEATTITGVVTAVRERFARVVVVDDGSSDETAALAAASGAVVVRHPINLGQGAALQTGIGYAVGRLGASYLVTFDADGQHSVDDAAAMVAFAHEHDLQVVLGSRSLGHTDAGRRRRLLLAAATRFTRLTSGLAVTDAHNGLRVLRGDVARDLDLRLHGMSHASEILDVVGARGWSWAEHPVTIVYTDYSRAKGQRGYNALNIVYDVAVNRVRATA